MPPRTSQLKRAIADMQEARLSHQHWADYFASCPDKGRCKTCKAEAKLVGNERLQRRWMKRYDNCIQMLTDLLKGGD